MKNFSCKKKLVFCVNMYFLNSMRLPSFGIFWRLLRFVVVSAWFVWQFVKFDKMIVNIFPALLHCRNEIANLKYLTKKYSEIQLLYKAFLLLLMMLKTLFLWGKYWCLFYLGIIMIVMCNVLLSYCFLDMYTANVNSKNFACNVNFF